MSEEEKDQPPYDRPLTALSRRGFIALSVAAGFAAAAGSAPGAELPVIQTNVDVKTPDGACDALFIHPQKGTHPGVLLWHDSPGLRPVISELGKRIAGEGYSVLVPNLFYRSARAPVFDASFDYANNPADYQPTFPSADALPGSPTRAVFARGGGLGYFLTRLRRCSWCFFAS